MNGGSSLFTSRSWTVSIWLIEGLGLINLTQRLIALVLPRVCIVTARDLWTHVLTKHCHFLPFFNSYKRCSVNNGFCEKSFILSLLHLCLIGIVYFGLSEWSMTFSIALGMQQIRKRSFCKLNKMVWCVCDIQGFSFITVVPSTAALSVSKPSSFASCGAQDSDK